MWSFLHYLKVIHDENRKIKIAITMKEDSWLFLGFSSSSLQGWMIKYISFAKIYTQMSLSVSHKILFFKFIFTFPFFIHSERGNDYFIEFTWGVEWDVKS